MHKAVVTIQQFTMLKLGIAQMTLQRSGFHMCIVMHLQCGFPLAAFSTVLAFISTKMFVHMEIYSMLTLITIAA